MLCVAMSGISTSLDNVTLTLGRHWLDLDIKVKGTSVYHITLISLINGNMHYMANV